MLARREINHRHKIAERLTARAQRRGMRLQENDAPRPDRFVAANDNQNRPSARRRARRNPGDLQGSLIGILDFVNDNQQPDASRVITRLSSGSREHRCYTSLEVPI